MGNQYSYPRRVTIPRVKEARLSNSYSTINGDSGQVQADPESVLTINGAGGITVTATEGSPDSLSIDGTGVGAVTNHHSLLGLSDDDHSIYLLASDATSRALFATNWLDLTDGGATTLHKHSHTSLDDIGTNTHAQIDTHIADTTIHFTEGSIDHGSIAGLADDDHTQYLNTTRHTAITGNPHSTKLNEIDNPDGNKTFNMSDNSVSFTFTNPTNQPTYDGAFEIQANGAFSGDLLHIHQHTGNPGAGTHLIHAEATDADVVPLLLTGAGTIDAQITNTIQIDALTASQIVKTNASKQLVSAATLDHTTELTNVGTNTHVQLDSHVADNTIHFTNASIDHGTVSGLDDDDHSQYHTDARGDARYYTETELDAGQLDNRYYTETELDAGQLDTLYYTEDEIDTMIDVAFSASGVTNGNSHDHSGGDGAQIDHGGLAGLSDDDHSIYHTDARGDARYYTETELDAGQLDNRYYTESELDAGQLDNRYYTESEVNTIVSGINHGDLENIGTDDHHAQLHTIASHSDTTATGAELETLTDNSIADSLHRHSELVASDGSPDPALSVDATGQVGIGCTPSCQLEINDSGACVVKMHAGAGEDSRLMVGSGGSGNRFSYLDLIGDDTYTNFGLRLIRNNGGANTTSDIIHRGTGGLRFITEDAGYITLSTSSTERMRIDSSGQVGIGTDTPTGKLDIAADFAQNDWLKIVNLNTLSTWGSTANYDDTRYIEVTGGEEYSNYFKVGPGGVSIGATFDPPTYARLGVDSLYCEGNVGIGTTTPASSLEINSAGEAGITLHSTTSATDNWIKMGVGGSGDRDNYIDMAGDATYTAYGLRILRSGGANGISYLLHRGTGELRFQGTDASPITFSTSATERVRIDSSGNVGIATNSPATKLDVNADSVRIRTSQSPASNGTGTQGEIAWDADYLYVCTATDTWKRVALTGGY